MFTILYKFIGVNPWRHHSWMVCFPMNIYGPHRGWLASFYIHLWAWGTRRRHHWRGDSCWRLRLNISKHFLPEAPSGQSRWTLSRLIKDQLLRLPPARTRWNALIHALCGFPGVGSKWAKKNTMIIFSSAKFIYIGSDGFEWFPLNGPDGRPMESDACKWITSDSSMAQVGAA